jgi:hypothetical protein
MPKIHTIIVNNETDITLARMRVRDLARRQGLNIVDQARISLATSSLAHLLQLGNVQQGEISVECLSHGTRTGLQVVCTTANRARPRIEAMALDDIRLLVDELNTRAPSSGRLQIALIKWRAG